MKTIEERAKKCSKQQSVKPVAYNAYIAGATEQKAIDDAELLKSSQGNCGIILEKLREYLPTFSQEELDAKYNELSELLSAEHVTTAYDEANYQQGYRDAVEKICNWLINYFVFEHEAMSAAGCDAFLRKLRKEVEE